MSVCNLIVYDVIIRNVNTVSDKYEMEVETLSYERFSGEEFQTKFLARFNEKLSSYVDGRFKEGDVVTIRGNFINDIRDMLVFDVSMVAQESLNLCRIDGRVGIINEKKNNVTIIRVATNDYKKSGSKGDDETDWHSVVCFNKCSDMVRSEIDVGDLVAVNGKIKQKEYNGNSAYEIHAHEIQLKRKKGK